MSASLRSLKASSSLNSTIRYLQVTSAQRPSRATRFPPVTQNWNGSRCSIRISAGQSVYSRAPGRQEDHRNRSGDRPAHRQAVRVVCARRHFTEGGGAQGTRSGPRLSQKRRQGAGEHNPQHPAQPALCRLVRMEGQTDPRPARGSDPGRAMGARSGRTRRPLRQEGQAWQARLRVFGPDRVRAMRLRGGRRDQEAALRLLSLHRPRR